MAENNWTLQDGRSILVEFDAAATAKAWGWFGNRSSGEGLEFDTAATAWADHAWLRGGQMVQTAEAGGGSVDCTVSSSQAQGSTATDTLSLSSTESGAQGQGALSVTARDISSTETSSQAQGSTVATGLALGSTEGSTQAQGATVINGLALDSTGSSEQGQSVAALLSSAGASIDSTVESGQCQSSLLDGILMPMPTPGFPLRNWSRAKQEEETEDEKLARFIAAGILPPEATIAVRKAIEKITNNESITKEIEAEYKKAVSAEIESQQLVTRLWEIEKQRILDDEDAAMLLL